MCLAIPGEIISVTGDDPLTRTGRVRFGGIVKAVNLAAGNVEEVAAIIRETGIGRFAGGDFLGFFVLQAIVNTDVEGSPDHEGDAAGIF